MGNVSTIARTPVMAANFSVSSESFEVPDAHPKMVRSALISAIDETGNGSGLAPTID